MTVSRRSLPPRLPPCTDDLVVVWSFLEPRRYAVDALVSVVVFRFDRERVRFILCLVLYSLWWTCRLHGYVPY